MKQLKVFCILMLTVIMLPLVMACSDSDEKKESSIVDGVNVVNGKKLIELLMYDEDNYYLYPNACSYKLEYDTKGRINKLLIKRGVYYKSKDSLSFDNDYEEFASIDYDLKMLIRDQVMYPFSLNKDGYISQIGTSFLTYDKNGYLSGVDEVDGIGQLVFEEDKLLKATISEYSNNNTSLFYVLSGDDDAQGELYIRINNTTSNHGIKTPIGNHFFGSPSACRRAIPTFIAYQAGLFGKVSKTVLNLTSEKDKQLILNYIKDGKSTNYKVFFKCE